MCKDTDRIHHCPWSVQSREKINAVVVGEGRHREGQTQKCVRVRVVTGWETRTGREGGLWDSCSPVVRAMPTLYHKPNADHFQSPSNWLSHLQIDWELGERDKYANCIELLSQGGKMNPVVMRLCIIVGAIALAIGFTSEAVIGECIIPLGINAIGLPR